MEFRPARRWMGRIGDGEDLWQWLEAFGRRNEICAGWISVIGAVKRAAFAYYDQEKRTYREKRIGRPLEIVSCRGNYSLKGGIVFPHVHVVYADAEGACVGGHLVPGAEVFLAEYEVGELEGPDLTRVLDEDLGLPIWPPED